MHHAAEPGAALDHVVIEEQLPVGFDTGRRPANSRLDGPFGPGPPNGRQQSDQAGHTNCRKNTG